MKILILGGTVFLGRALVDAALAGEHEVTLFNRGKSGPDLFPHVEQIRGDRDEDISGLSDRRWDAVIDTSGFLPQQVQRAIEALVDSVGLYAFISSISVYADTSQPGIDESAPVAVMENPDAVQSKEQITGENYGPLKALCEQVVERNMPGRALNIRPGLIVGPFDPTDRFSYWPSRVAQGGEVLAPGRPERVVQFIDVRDLAEWTVRMLEKQQAGVYNATGLVPPVSMGELLEACRMVSGSDSRITWVPESFLLEQQVEPWMQVPLWVPESLPEYEGFFDVSVDRAVRAGLTFRPVEETVRATLKWLATRPAGYDWRAGLTREREAELLSLYHDRYS